MVLKRENIYLSYDLTCVIFYYVYIDYFFFLNGGRFGKNDKLLLIC